MKAFIQLDRIKKMNNLIKNKRTGNPQEFAKQLGICQSQLFNLIDDLKIMGAPISYSRKSQSYYYNTDFEIDLHYSINFIHNNHLKKIFGGNQKNIFTPIFIE